MGASPGFRLFLSASGSIGGVMTARTWKGWPAWNPFSRPGKQKSSRQELVCCRFAIAERSWKRSFNTDAIRHTWRLAAGEGYKPQSGYNAYMTAAFHALILDPGVMMVSAAELIFNQVRLYVTIVDPDVPRSTHEHVVVSMGTSPASMLPWFEGNLDYDWLLTPALPGGGIYFLRMTYDGSPVSGLIKLRFL